MSTDTDDDKDIPNRETPVPTERWMRNEPVDAPFLHAQALRFLANLLSKYRGMLDDVETFTPIACVIHHDKLVDVFYSVTTPGIRRELRASFRHSIGDPTRETPYALLSGLWCHPKTRAALHEALRSWFDFARKALEVRAKETDDPTPSRLEEVKGLFGLTPSEMDVLIASIATQEGVWPSRDLGGKLSRRRSARWAALLGLPVEVQMGMLHAKSKLRRLNCVDANGDIDGGLQAFVAGINDQPISSVYFKRCETEPLPWHYFGELTERHGDLLTRLLAPRTPIRGVNILFHGEPGTGKTSLALALAAVTGRTPYLVAQTCYSSTGNKVGDFRLAAVEVCDKQVDPAKSLIIVDEADRMLSDRLGGCYEGPFSDSASPGKGALNDILDAVSTPCIWITNASPDEMHSSNRRRFDYSVRFDRLSRAQRSTIWRNVACKHGVGPVLTDPLIAGLAVRYEVDAGSIELAVRNMASLQGKASTTTETAEQLLDRILTPHCELLGISQGKRPSAVCSDYALEGLRLKTPIPLARIEQSMRVFLAQQAACQRDGVDTPRMTLLLSGPPGTGKTEFVKYLGCVLARPIVVKMGSDLLSMWVGSTERNIRAAFHEASSERAILFMDEFDGLLQSRNNARQSWEVTQVNELLHQIENFDGIFVAATNFSENLDAAAIRRFTFKVEFDYLDTAGKVVFFERMCERELDEGQRARLAAIPNLAPGDFRTARQSLFCLGDTCVTDDYLDALQAESTAKAQGRKTVATVGF